jgi:hypothetical protein
MSGSPGLRVVAVITLRQRIAMMMAIVHVRAIAAALTEASQERKSRATYPVNSLKPMLRCFEFMPRPRLDSGYFSESCSLAAAKARSSFGRRWKSSFREGACELAVRSRDAAARQSLSHGKTPGTPERTVTDEPGFALAAGQIARERNDAHITLFARRTALASTA